MFRGKLKEGQRLEWVIGYDFFIVARIERVHSDGPHTTYDWTAIDCGGFGDWDEVASGSFSGTILDLHQWFLDRHVAWQTWEVRISHPSMDQWISAVTWMLTGPGPRSLVDVVDVRDSGFVSLGKGVIPLRYRNSRTARLLKRIGIVSNPWKHTPSP